MRGDIEEPELEEEEQTDETEENQKDSEEAGSGQETEQQTEEQEDTPENQQPKRQEFRKLNPEQKMQAEKLLEIVYMERKKARLPGFQYGRMVKYARQVIEQYPGTEEAAKAQRALAEIPERYRQRYRITDEELGPYK